MSSSDETRPVPFADVVRDAAEYIRFAVEMPILQRGPAAPDSRARRYPAELTALAALLEEAEQHVETVYPSPARYNLAAQSIVCRLGEGYVPPTREEN